MISVKSIVHQQFTTPSGTISDSQGNTYTQDNFGISGYGAFNEVAFGIYRTIATSTGPLTITVTTPNASLISFAIDEFSFSGTISVDAASTPGQAGSTTPTSGTITTTATDLVVALFDINLTGLTYTPGSGYTLGFTEAGSTSRAMVSEYNVAVTSGSSTPNCTISTSASWSAMSVAYTATAATTFIYSSDSATGTETAESQLYGLDSEVAASSDQFLFATSFISTDIAKSLDSQTSVNSFILTDIPPSGFDSFINILGESSDFASTAENGYVDASISDTFLFNADSAHASDAALTIFAFFDGDSSTASEANYLVTASISTTSGTTDSAVGSEAFQRVFALSQVSTTFDTFSILHLPPTGPPELSKDLTAGHDTQYVLSLLPQSSSARSHDAQFDTSVLFSIDIARVPTEASFGFIGLSVDQATAFDAFLPNRSSGDVTTALESIFLSRSSIASSLTVDLATARDAQFLTSTIPVSGNSSTDQAIGFDAGIPTFQSSGNANDSAASQETNLTYIIGGDRGRESSNFLRYISASESPIARDIYWLTTLLISAGSSVTDLAIASESFLTFHLPSDQASTSESFLTIMGPSGDVAHSFDNQYLSTSHISTSTSNTTDQAIGTDSGSSILYVGFGGSTDQAFGTSVNIGTTTDVTPSANTLVDVYWSILDNLSKAGFIPTNSWTYIVNPEEPDTPWPTIPVPFVMIEPLAVNDTGNQVGAGRYGVVWEVEFKIHIVVGNILDQSWQDPILTTSYDPNIGPYEIVDKIVNVMCQSYPLNPKGQPTLIELPYTTGYGPTYRNKRSGDYSVVPITFKCTYHEVLVEIPIYPNHQDVDQEFD